MCFIFLMKMSTYLFQSILEHLDPPHQIILQILLSLSLTLNGARVEMIYPTTVFWSFGL